MEFVLDHDSRLRNSYKDGVNAGASDILRSYPVDHLDVVVLSNAEPGARKVRDLATLAFVEAKSNIALLGPPGVGKTMLAVGLAVAACQAGYSIYFTTLDDLIRRLRAAEATGRFARQLTVA